MRLVRLTLASALIAALTPLALHAQRTSFPRCADGTIATRTGYTACWFHGGVADGKTAAKPLPPRASSTARVATSKPRPATKAATSAKRSGKAAKKASKNKAKAAKTKKAKKAKKAKASRAQEPTLFRMPVATASRSAAAKPRKSASSGMRAPKGATARCMDGTFTTAQRKKKACSKHGGVAGWIKPDIPPE